MFIINDNGVVIIKYLYELMVICKVVVFLLRINLLLSDLFFDLFKILGFKR